jgi:hypothetical protein
MASNASSRRRRLGKILSLIRHRDQLLFFRAQSSVKHPAAIGFDMSFWGAARCIIPRNTTRPAYALLDNAASRSVRSRTFTTCRRHEAQIRARKSLIRQHIQALERSRRGFSTSPRSTHGHIDPPKPGEELHVTFIDKDGDRHEFEVAEGDNLLDIAQANDLEMEGKYTDVC